MTPRESFLWGLVGGLAPEILRFFKIVAAGAQLPQLNWLLYMFFLLLYALLAGAISVAFKLDSPWKALWVGASLPAIVAVLIQSPPAHS